MPLCAIQKGLHIVSPYRVWTEWHRNIKGYRLRFQTVNFVTLSGTKSFTSPLKKPIKGGNKHLVIYADGACSGNGKSTAQAGYGVHCPLRPELDSYGALRPDEPHTNQRAELHAIRQALQSTRDVDMPIEIRTDSRYGIGCATNWSKRWEEQNWNVEKKNLDIVRDIVEETRSRNHPVHYKHVKGHSGEPGNERADYLANKGIYSPHGDFY
jgi:ribonuclease HI